MAGKSITGNRKKSKKSDDSNCSEGSRWNGTNPAVEEVFGIDWLREEILDYVIYDSKGKQLRQVIKNTRLVQKSWLQTTTKILRKLKKPVIHLTVDCYGSLEDAMSNKEKEKALSELVETFGTSQKLPESFLPVKLDFNVDFFFEENYQCLSDCLTHLGNDLVELELEYPKDGGTMPVTFPQFTLPHLRKLSFNFSEEELELDDDDVFGDNRNGLGLLQSILNGSKNLQDLGLPLSENGEVVVPMSFQYLRLPTTISVLDMRTLLKSKDLEVLLRNELPNLSHLTLQLHDIPFVDGLLFKILERFQKTLETLLIYGLTSIGRPRPASLLRFPLMEKLKAIKIDCMECELDLGNVSALQKSLPELTAVNLMSQTEARLAKWVEYSKFKNVEMLSVSVANEGLKEEDEGYYMSPGSEIMTQIQQTFPNVSSLSLTVNISDLSSLKSVFQNMVQLQSLRLTFFRNGTVLDNSSDLIDSIFLGLPLRLVIPLKEDMELLETQTIVINSNVRKTSIRNLSALVSLDLVTVAMQGADHEENGTSLISNLLFRHALMKMAKLQTLWHNEKFKPSLEMEKEWERQGRFLKYSDV